MVIKDSRVHKIRFNFEVLTIMFDEDEFVSVVAFAKRVEFRDNRVGKHLHASGGIYKSGKCAPHKLFDIQNCAMFIAE